MLQKDENQKGNEKGRKSKNQIEPITLSWMITLKEKHPNQEDNYYNIANEANTNKDM